MAAPTKTTEEPKPITSDGAPPCWPPKAHIVDKRTDKKVALCGAKMMGIDLEGMAVKDVCKECVRIAGRRPD